MNGKRYSDRFRRYREEFQEDHRVTPGRRSARIPVVLPCGRSCAALQKAVQVFLLLILSLPLTLLQPQLQPALAQMPPEVPEIDTGTRSAIIDSITTALNEVYVFPEKAVAMEEHVRALLAEGAYNEITSPAEYAQRLTEDLRSICQDRHLRVGAEPPRSPEEVDETDEQRRARYREQGRRSNYQFEKVEILPGNIGYLRFNAFMGAEIAGATAVAALNFLANADALIIDLRGNGGGSPSLIQLMTSYFLEESTHLNSFYIRKNDETKQFWTQAHVQGPKLVDVPIYVLTSQYTFSGAEEFTYNLKNLERATIIGETTGGGAHPVEGHWFDFGEFIITMSLPFGRAINPITGTNWEGTGVDPHIPVPAEDALMIAQIEALKKLQEGATDEDVARQIAWVLGGLEVQLNPVTVSEAELMQYVGTYGPRRIWHEGNSLWYQREDRPRYPIVPMGNDTFLLSGLDYFRIRFERDDNGKVVKLVGMYDNGFQDEHDRSEG